jgi:hypothetical protein
LNPAAAFRDTPAGDLRGQVSGLPRNWKLPWLPLAPSASSAVLQAIFKAIEDGDGCCVATLATLARASNTSKTTTRNAIARAVAIGMLEETEPGSYGFGRPAGGVGEARESARSS